jgi:hypothetical protein
MFNFFKKYNNTPTPAPKSIISIKVYEADCKIESGKHNHCDNIPRLSLEIIKKYNDGSESKSSKTINGYFSFYECLDLKFQNKKYLDRWSNGNCIIKTYSFKDINIDITGLDDNEIDVYFSKYLQSL